MLSSIYADYDQAKDVNDQVNADVRYATDMEVYQVWEKWVVLATGQQRGDCDDSGMTKRDRLLDLGWPIEKLRMACVFTEVEEGQQRLALKRAGNLEVFGDHALVIVSTRIGDFLLDNRFKLPMLLSDTFYVIDRLQVAGTANWEHGRGSLPTK